MQVARTLLVLSDVARAAGEAAMARAANAERRAIVEGIGPETQGLVWAR